jgi:hypothetical protein
MGILYRHSESINCKKLKIIYFYIGKINNTEITIKSNHERCQYIETYKEFYM